MLGALRERTPTCGLARALAWPPVGLVFEASWVFLTLQGCPGRGICH